MVPRGTIRTVNTTNKGLGTINMHGATVKNTKFVISRRHLNAILYLCNNNNNNNNNNNKQSVSFNTRFQYRPSS